jgi:hypothetical protein
MRNNRDENYIDKNMIIKALDEACNAVNKLADEKKFFPFQLSEDDFDDIIVSESEDEFE